MKRETIVLVGLGAATLAAAAVVALRILATPAETPPPAGAEPRAAP